MNKQAAHDRMVAVARAKDQIKHEMLQEMDRVREKLKQVGDFISEAKLFVLLFIVLLKNFSSHGDITFDDRIKLHYFG